MKDLPGEVFIQGFMGDALLLSNLRLQYWTTERYISLHLEHITYIDYQYLKLPWILYRTLIGASIALFLCIWKYQETDEASIFFLPVAVLIIGLVIYYSYRTIVLIFATSGGKILIKSDFADKGAIFSFIENVEHAMQNLKK